MLDNCSVGCALQASCHYKTCPSLKQALHLLESLSDDEQELLKRRVAEECDTGMEVKFDHNLHISQAQNFGQLIWLIQNMQHPISSSQKAHITSIFIELV